MKRQQASVAENRYYAKGNNEISNKEKFEKAIEIEESFEDDGLIHFSEITITS